MTDTDEIVTRINAVPCRSGRRIVAIAGAPASGKSTLAKELAKRISQSCVVPMDGFHRSNEDLDSSGLLDRKGAPETFDAAGFVRVIRSVRTTPDLTFPTFDRENDCVVPDGGRLTASDQTILVEGNYVITDAEPWSGLQSEWDFRVMLEIPLDVLQDRLVDRWLRNGYDAAGALARANRNDLPNAKLVMRNSLPADLTLVAFGCHDKENQAAPGRTAT